MSARFRVDPISVRVWCAGKQTGSHKKLSPFVYISSVSSPPNPGPAEPRCPAFANSVDPAQLAEEAS